MDISTIPWILLVIIAALLGTFSAFIDNFTADVVFNGKYAQAEKMIFGPLYIILGIVLMAIFRPTFNEVLPIVLLFGAGIVSAFGSIPYFAGLQREETTTSKIFAQLIPVFNLALAWIFLHQEISGRQLIAFAVILLAPVLIIVSKKRKKSKKLELKAAICFTVYALFSAVSALLFVSGSNMMIDGAMNLPASATGIQSFLPCLAVMVCGKGTGDVLIMAVKKDWRRHFFRRLKLAPFRMIITVGGNFLVWTAADLLYRFSMVNSGSVALTAVTYEAMELIGTFFFGIVLSLLWPNFGREKLDKRSVLVHLIATGIALVGILLIK